MTDGGDAGDGPPLKSSSPRKLVFDNSASQTDFGGFPVLVALDASIVDYSMIADPKTDLRFEYATPGSLFGDNVAFEVERWNPGGESIVWIRVPEIKAGTTDTAVLMHYGPTAGGAASATATWATWELVNHMATGLTNSAGAYTPTAINVTFAPGQFGEAAVFQDNTDRRITFANGGALFDGWSDFHLSFWIYADYASAADIGGQPLVMDKGTSVNLGRLYNNASSITFQLDQHFSGSNDTFLTTVIQPRTWTNIAIDFDGRINALVTNGVRGSVADLGSTRTLLGSTAQFRLGDNGNAFQGMLDELRIERRSRTIDFARAQYYAGARKFVMFTDP